MRSARASQEREILPCDDVILDKKRDDGVNRTARGMALSDMPERASSFDHGLPLLTVSPSVKT